MTPLPLTVIGGYLGAGKTTLINQILSANHGLRIMVLVNDFGSINIDASLLISASQDTLELSNGCVCCTIGADLFLAIGDVLDRKPRPDHIIIEASGIADPARIANVAQAEPELLYSGIATVVDGLQFDTLSGDPLVAAQFKDQIACAQVIAVSKAPLQEDLRQNLSELNPDATILPVDRLGIEQLLMTGQDPTQILQSSHPAYAKWSYSGDRSLGQTELTELLHSRPEPLYRLKGHMRGPNDTGYLVQVVGSSVEVHEIAQPPQTELIGIGLAARLMPETCDEWWAQGACDQAAHQTALQS
ncbi:GTP-binding protein [Shimia sp. R9_1]|uniref:CobW family GTP-binding protein n=1 Tax=Shimia sp. R9_1 TaxID=2821111 RepID=UPI001AD9D570|nr:CobW family GTP-binding protein [Shimia sp. R9_1]MBO9409282.1 GTP-binding protein [Shimia sp. R9_1]